MRRSGVSDWLRVLVVLNFILIVGSQHAYAAERANKDAGMVLDVKGAAHITVGGKKSVLDAFTPLKPGALVELKAGAEVQGTSYGDSPKSAQSFTVKGPSVIRVTDQGLKVESGQAIVYTASSGGSTGSKATTQSGDEASSNGYGTGYSAGAVRMRSVIKTPEPMDTPAPTNSNK